jgi:hypothetical protein
VQVLRAGGDAITIGTETEARCFDAGTGEPLWDGWLLEEGLQLLDATRDVLVVADEKRVIAISPDRAEFWSVRRSGGPVAARMSCDHLVVSEQGKASVLALASGEEQWRGKTAGELVVADERLLVPGDGQSSLVYGLRDSAVTKIRTSAALARPVRPGVRILDGTLVPAVTGAGPVVLLDLADSVEAESTAPVPHSVERAWLAGPFLIATPPLSVSHLWGGVATAIPLALDPTIGALVAGPAQALVRSAERTVWLDFS